MNNFICENCEKEFLTKKWEQKYCVPCYRKLYDMGEIKVKDPVPDHLTELQNDVFIGSMLGDGSLSKKKQEHYQSGLIIIRSIKDIDYLLWQHNIFKDFCIRPPKKIPALKEIFGKEILNPTDGYGFYTRSGGPFTKEKDNWYKDNIKIIPQNLSLTKMSIAVWLADDGSIFYGKKKNGEINKTVLKSSFSTHCFTEKEVLFLIDLLNKRYNETFHLGHDKKNYKGTLRNYPIIYGANKATRTMLEDIDDIFPLQRKADIWRDPNVNFYNNKPKSRVSGKLYKEQKSNDLLKFLLEKNETDEFYYKDIAESLNWYTTRNSEQNVPTDIIRKYLTKYISDGSVSFEFKLVDGIYKNIYKVSPILYEKYIK